jgi:hypothetical protein
MDRQETGGREEKRARAWHQCTPLAAGPRGSLLSQHFGLSVDNGGRGQRACYVVSLTSFALWLRAGA